MIIVTDTDGERTRFPADWNGAVRRNGQLPKVMQALHWNVGDVVECLHPESEKLTPIKFTIMSHSVEKSQ